MKKRLFVLLNRGIAWLLLLSVQNFAFAGNNPDDHSPTGFYKKDITVRGAIKDEAGSPLAGATVTEKGTNNRVIAGSRGDFTITVKTNESVLVISYVGFETQEIAVVSGRDMEITLLHQVTIATEVVVTALGIRKEKQKVSYATQEVKGAALEKAPEPNVAENLIGKVAGLNILAKTNLFENPEIFLRGKETLVVIDGVPTDKGNFDFWSLNPNDIENVNVLKGTAAAALYGA